MPGRKRKLSEVSENKPTLSFLLLPLEIRVKIYEYCYVPCHVNHPQHQSGVTCTSRITNVISSKIRERRFFESSRCSHPFQHQSLLFVCRRTHADVWPMYIANHSIRFERPITFANDYLSFQPPQCLAMIKHLSLHMNDVSRYQLTSPRAISGMVTDVRRLFDHYPDLFYNLLSFTLETCCTQFYCPTNESAKEAVMRCVLTSLVEQHLQERRDIDWDMGDDPPKDAITLKHWRVGIVSRTHVLRIRNSVVQSKENCMLFLELSPQAHDRPARERKGLRFIDVNRWLSDKATTVNSTVGQRVRLLIRSNNLDWLVAKLPFSPHYKHVKWQPGQVDWKSGTDRLGEATIFDVGFLGKLE